jgi:outer membrane protein assembly factor BamB
MKKIFALLVFIALSSCKNLDSIFGDKKTGEKIYQSDVMIKIDYELSGQEIVLEDGKALYGNTSTHLPSLQMKTNHLIDAPFFQIKKFTEGIANTQLLHERKVYVNFSPIILSNLIITIADNNIIYAFDLSGKRIWSLNLKLIQA